MTPPKTLRAKLIDPAIHERGWPDVICRETTLGAVDIGESKPQSRSQRLWPIALGFVLAVGLLPSCTRMRAGRDVQTLRAGEPPEKVAAAARLGELKYLPAVPVLLERAHDGDVSVRIAALRALGAIGDPRAVDAFVAAVGDPATTAAAIDGLRQLGPTAEPRLVNRLSTGDPTEQKAAARLLGNLPSASAIGALTEAALNRSTHSMVREAALAALAQHEDAAVVDRVIAALRSGDKATIVLACKVAAASKSPRLVDALVPHLRNPGGGEVAMAAQEALGAIGRPALPALLAALEDPDEGMRSFAAIGLGGTADAQAATALVRHVDRAIEASPGVRAQAENSLANLGAAGYAALLDACRSAKPDVRLAAIEAFGTGTRVRRPPALEAVTAFLAALGDRDSEVAAAAAGHLASIDDPRADAVLTAAYEKRDYRIVRAAARYYLKKRPPGFEPVLIAALQDGHASDRGSSAAADALLNSHNPTLERAAQQWASRHGLRAQTMLMPR